MIPNLLPPVNPIEQVRPLLSYFSYARLHNRGIREPHLTSQWQKDSEIEEAKCINECNEIGSKGINIKAVQYLEFHRLALHHCVTSTDG